MFCPQCGKRNADGAQFCSGCGWKLKDASVLLASAASPKKHAKSLAIAIVCVAVALVVVVGAVSWVLWQSAEEQKRVQDELAHRSYAVEIGIEAEGYDQATSSPVPIRVTGEDFEGNAISLCVLVGAEGCEPLELARGNYEATALGSPITAEGVIFVAPETPVEIAVEGSSGDSGSGQAVVSVSAPLAFEALAPLDTTDEQIAAARDALMAAGFDEARAQTFADGATACRDAAVEQERQRQEEERRQQQLAANREAAAGFQARFNSLNAVDGNADTGDMTMWEMNNYAADRRASYDELMDDVMAYLKTVLSEEAFSELQQAQDSWLASRSQAMEAVRSANGRGTIVPLLMNEKGIEYDQVRIPELIAMIPTT